LQRKVISPEEKTMATRKLPKGVQGFEKIRKEGYLYVDKTDIVWQIANGDVYNFLSRPRRFGKSLLTNTLKCYFEGRKDLFEGLKIMDLETEWPKRQVFFFDFSGKETAEDLYHHINTILAKYETIYGKFKTDESLSDRFVSLMENAHEKTGQQVAVLVDEYDAPLQHTLFKDEEHEKMVVVYRSFFPALKTAGDHLKCLFLTGITKFTQLSLFSTLNNISIIGNKPKYATVCGITQQEILDNFQPELQAMGDENGWTMDETVARLKDMYDGYRFSKDANPDKMVYNPYSLICALDDREMMNYWASSGGSRLLIDILQKSYDRNIDLENCTLSALDMETADVSIDNVPLFLYQAGYLTIKDYNGRNYKLGFPNMEVRNTLYDMILPKILRKDKSNVTSSIGNIQDALDADDIPTMMENLKQLFAETPYSQNSQEYLTEERYRFIMRQTFSLVGCRIEEERQVAKGRIDMVAEYMKNTVLIFEMKLDKNGGVDAAVAQHEDRDYAAAYGADGKKVYKIAVSFCSDKRGIADYQIG